MLLIPRIVDGVIGMAQVGKTVVEDVGEVLLIAGADVAQPFVGVWTGDGVVYNAQDFLPVRQARSIDIAAQACPVLRGVAGVDDGCVEVEVVGDVVLEGEGTVLGQPNVVLVRSFWGGIAMDGQRIYFVALVVEHAVEVYTQFVQLSPVFMVVRPHGDAVEDEVDVHDAFLLKAFCDRLHCCGWCGLFRGFHHLPGVLVHDVAATGVVCEYQFHCGTVHPFLGTYGAGIANRLLHAPQILCTVHDVRLLVLEEMESAADGIVVGDAPINAH